MLLSSALLFGNEKILSPHYRNPHFYTTLKHFTHLKRNHTNNNHLYSPTLNH